MTFQDDIVRLLQAQVKALTDKVEELEAKLEVNLNNQKEEYYENR
jgi:hypothetical protein